MSIAAVAAAATRAAETAAALVTSHPASIFENHAETNDSAQSAHPLRKHSLFQRPWKRRQHAACAH